MRRLLKRLHGERGFTLIELVVAMPLMLIVMGGMVLMLTTLTKQSSQNQEETVLQTEARSALNRLEMEFRGAFVGDGTEPIVSGGPTSITFYSPDQYGSGPTTASSFHLRKISYQVTPGGLLQRQVQTSTNQFPTATCLSCGGTSQWTWGTTSNWATVVGLNGQIINTNATNNTCKPTKASDVPAVFCYYQSTDILNTIDNPQSTSSWTDNWNPQSFTGTPPLLANPDGVTVLVVTLELSTGGNQTVKFVVSDTISMRTSS